MPRLAFFAAISCSAITAAAQDGGVRFVVEQPFIRFAVHDVPGFLAALPETRLGKLFAEPDAADALASALQTYGDKVRRWRTAVDALDAFDASAMSWLDLVEKDLYELDWHDIRSAEAIATRPSDAGMNIQTTLLLEPVPAAEAKLAQRFSQLADRTWKRFDADGAAATPEQKAEPAEQKIDGHPARIASKVRWSDPVELSPNGAWFLHLPGQFAAGIGDPALAGRCRTVPPSPPSITLEVDVAGYAEMMTAVFGDENPMRKALDALGLGEMGVLSVRVAPRGELLHEEITVPLGKLAGLPAALVHGVAPLVDQPLPERGILQVRWAFDVRELVEVVDGLCAENGMPTLQQAGLAEDLHKAWTGGIGAAICRAPGTSPVPRIYASFGVVDAAALDRLLARLLAEPWLKKKDVTYEGQACVQLSVDGLPPALSPTSCIRDGVLHFAESGASLRAMLKAAAANAPKALDVGDAKRPDGKGAIVPGFDLRYDGAEVYAAMYECWLPLLEFADGPGAFDSSALLRQRDLPRPDVVARHLVRGRGMLRQQDDRLVLAMNGTAGGPDLLALLTAFGPALSAQATASWHWRTESVTFALASAKLVRIHGAIEAFTKKTGKRPDSLAALLASGELLDATVLSINGDAHAEPVVVDGKEIARTSFRYYADGIELEPQGERVKLRLITIAPGSWQRAAIGVDGTAQQGYGEFASKKLEELERQR